MSSRLKLFQGYVLARMYILRRSMLDRRTVPALPSTPSNEGYVRLLQVAECLDPYHAYTSLNCEIVVCPVVCYVALP